LVLLSSSRKRRRNRHHQVKQSFPRILNYSLLAAGSIYPSYSLSCAEAPFLKVYFQDERETRRRAGEGKFLVESVASSLGNPHVERDWPEATPGRGMVPGK